MNRFVRWTAPTLAGVGIGLLLDGLGAFGGLQSLPAAIVGAVLVAGSLGAWVWALHRYWGSNEGS